MVFSSLEFLLRFLPAVLLLYFVVPGRFKNLFLLIASLFFYAWGEPVYVALMIVSCLVNYLLGIAVDRSRGTPTAKAALIVSIVTNLLALGFFKYADFLIETINQLFGLHIGFWGLPLPIGISFYTFQALSYTVDVYRGRAPVLKNLVTLAAYFSQFPRLLAGPIVRYPSIAQELDHRTHSLDLFAQGVHRFVLGLGKKVLIADNVGVIWAAAAATANPSVLGRWLGIVAFALQIYFDFSGYSDMAIGLGRMFGFHFPENFNFPYISQSITEFWRRWHMSLGQWFQAYFFNPLTRALRSCPLPSWMIILIGQVGTMVLIGLWHGANWNFCLWGLYFGIVLVVEKLFLGRLLERLPRILRHAYALLIVLIGWVIFELDSVPAILGYLGDMFALSGIDLYNPESLYLLRSNLVLLLIATIGALPLAKNVYERVSGLVLVRIVAMPAFYALVLVASIAYVVDSSFRPFLYFRF
jgi:alginate O-acetyltransferase complex protein AlgI